MAGGVDVTNNRAQQPIKEAVLCSNLFPGTLLDKGCPKALITPSGYFT